MASQKSIKMFSGCFGEVVNVDISSRGRGPLGSFLIGWIGLVVNIEGRAGVIGICKVFTESDPPSKIVKIYAEVNGR